MATEGSVKPYLCAVDLAPEARARRVAIAAKLNRCPHDVNVTARRCPTCDAQGISFQPPMGANDGRP